MTRVGSEVLKLEYVVIGCIGDIRFSHPGPAERADRLWQHSCFEAFVALTAGGYVEFNFAPSEQWAIYRFEGYRDGMYEPIEVAPPDIYTDTDGSNRFALTAWVDLSALILAGPSSLALSAVIESVEGDLSYWALAHPPGAPDFHHPDCFTLELPASPPA